MVGRSPDVVVDLDGALRGPAERLVPAGAPVLTDGDGVFETTLLRDGRPCLLEAHLARLARSEAVVGLPGTDPARWRAAVAVAARHWGGHDGVLRLVSGRGAAFVMVSGVPQRAHAARRDGLAAVTLNPGPRGAVAGAKSLSYALNVAALAEAGRRGAGDAIFVDDDGVVLEGPRSSVVIAQSETLLSPPPTLPILAGTTVGALFEIAPRTAYRTLTVTDLFAAQGVWLVSAVTLCARVHTLDGRALADAPADGQLHRLVQRAVSR
ncbi:aminotransferase class IV [Mycobacterium sp. AMU20-3851]|uniref:aminotransferase class IV n=1 Tax=Mycobacterium sp. AMU20-3851 TaxID=3122055 RepID=UPI003754CA52